MMKVGWGNYRFLIDMFILLKINEDHLQVTRTESSASSDGFDFLIG